MMFSSLIISMGNILVSTPSCSMIWYRITYLSMIPLMSISGGGFHSSVILLAVILVTVKFSGGDCGTVGRKEEARNQVTYMYR